MLSSSSKKNEELEVRAEAGSAKEKKLEKYVKSLSEEVKKGNEIIKRLQVRPGRRGRANLIYMYSRFRYEIPTWRNPIFDMGPT